MTSSLKEWPQLLRERLSVLPGPVDVRHVLLAGDPHRGGLDGSAMVSLGGERVRIAVECVEASGHPGPVRRALDRLENSRPVGSVALLVSPYLAPESRRLLRERGINWLDLAGNFRFSHGSVYLEVARTDENPFKTARGRTSLFAPRAALVLDELLESSGRTWKVTELAQASGASLGSVSKVRRELVEREWAHAGADGLRLTQPLLLLDAWAAVAAGRRMPMLAQAHTTLHGKALEDGLRAAFAEVEPKAKLLLATHSVARRMAPFARVAGEFFYASVPALEVLRRFVPFEQVSTGGNLVFYDVAQADLPRRESVMAGAVRGTGRIRTYLDLLTAGERGREAASHFRREVIEPHLGEVTRG